MIIPVFLILSTLAIHEKAEARTYDLYRSDRRFKGAFCTAIGGACVADDDIVTGIFENPASLATGKPDWDFDGDYSAKSNLEPGMNDNLDRNESTAVIGTSYSRGSWGIGLAFALQNDDVEGYLANIGSGSSQQKVPLHTHSKLFNLKIPFGFQLSPKLSMGVGLSASRHFQRISISNSSRPDTEADSNTTFGLSLGALYAISPRIRLGAWTRIPSSLYEKLSISSSSGNIPVNYEESIEFRNPWILGLGAQFSSQNGDLYFTELDFIGTTGDGFLYSFDSLSSSSNNISPSPKGRWFTVEPHLGYRHPLSGKMRLHLGSYLETPRTSGVSLRAHGTGGLSFEIFQALEIIVGIDMASRYQQIIFTVR